MLKSIFIVAAAAVALSPFAVAEGKLITVKIAYDGDLLATPEGAASVLETIEIQANRACSSKSLMSLNRVDRACAADITAKAIEKIQEAQAAEGRAVATTFAALDPKFTSTQEQR